MTDGKAPDHKVRVGNIQGTAWENTHERKDGSGKFTTQNFTFLRTYKEGDDFKNSTSFNKEDLPKLKLAVEMMYAHYAVTSEGTETKE